MQYEVETIGQRKFYFRNEAHAGVEFVAEVDVLNTSQDNDLDDEAYSDLQSVFPNTWHDWRLEERVDNF